MNQHFILVSKANFLYLFPFSFFNFSNLFTYFFSLILLRLFFVFVLFFQLFQIQMIYQVIHKYFLAIDLVFNLNLFILNFFMNFFLHLYHFTSLPTIFFQEPFLLDLIIFKQYMLDFLYSSPCINIKITDNGPTLPTFVFFFG